MDALAVTVLAIVLLAVLLALRAAWRARPTLGLGLTFGLLLSALFVTFVGWPEFKTVPLWLPPLPFAVVAVTLFVFGILAWVWGDDDARR